MAKKKRKSTPKQRIEHGVYGLGTVVGVDDRFTTIKFDQAGSRRFVTAMVEYKLSDTPRPTKSRSKNGNPADEQGPQQDTIDEPTPS